MKNFCLSICIVLILESLLTAQDAAQQKKLKIFILAGQSNMEGKGSVYTMNQQLADPNKKSRFEHLRRNGEWIERDDVWIDYLGARGQRFGKLTVGYGVSQRGSQQWFGPELGFGWTLGDHLEEDVLIIKAAWGGKSIDRDFRPPSRGYPDSITEMYERAKKRNDQLTLDDFKKTYGHYYRQMIGEVKKVLSDIKTYVPHYRGQGYELAGFVWFQGWNDMFGPTSVEDYKDNLIAFINDVRSEMDAPGMPFVIGAMGHDGANQKGKAKQIADAQVAASQHPDFQGNVTTVLTTKYWDTEAEEAFHKYWADEQNRDIDMWRKFGNDRGYHYLGSPVFFYNAGVGFGEAMIELMEAEK